MNTTAIDTRSLSATALASGLKVADINLPDARQNGTAGTQGEGASVEVSISAKAQALVAIDMNSLAAKGYSQVGIDTDGVAGAEITVNVRPGAGTVLIAPGSAQAPVTQATGLEQEQNLVDVLLEALEKRAEKAKEAQLAAGAEAAADGTAQPGIFDIFAILLETMNSGSASGEEDKDKPQLGFGTAVPGDSSGTTAATPNVASV